MDQTKGLPKEVENARNNEENGLESAAAKSFLSETDQLLLGSMYTFRLLGELH